ncbi:hypothetical protein GCM10027413_24630 [Conyzicola nivalis]|uniref:Uncharacterized protein n=1 Tax=Conyzicola nivalis TaxID=1477021 RepID=A0A916SCB6_9MICO|nr:hypothetical protein [Conyzicola nivalis]GGA90930.1 hypothetical protein GCM10010979_01990 [Conyzicola nivalis]
MTDEQPTPAAAEDRAALLSALVTEHFVLQSAASSTIGESGSRASIYLATLSSGLVAIGFSSSNPDILAGLAFTIFPTVFILGCFTVVRLIDTSIANVVALNRIELIRRYYSHLHPLAKQYFAPDDSTEAGTLGVRYRARSVLFTAASMVAVVNAVVGGAGLTVILSIGTTFPAGVGVALGVVAGVVVLGLGLAYQVRRFAPLLSASRSTPADG